MNILNLYSKPVDYKFSKEEIESIKKEMPIDKFMVYYAFYKKKSLKGAQIEFIIDQTPYATRRSPLFNNWDIHTKRTLSKLEWLEMVENFGCNRRRFIVWHYQDIDYLIEEDKKYGVTTPQAFIDECEKRGYKRKQLKINFDEENNGSL